MTDEELLHLSNGEKYVDLSVSTCDAGSEWFDPPQISIPTSISTPSFPVEFQNGSQTGTKDRQCERQCECDGSTGIGSATATCSAKWCPFCQRPMHPSQTGRLCSFCGQAGHVVCSRRHEGNCPQREGRPPWPAPPPNHLTQKDAVVTLGEAKRPFKKDVWHKEPSCWVRKFRKNRRRLFVPVGTKGGPNMYSLTGET